MPSWPIEIPSLTAMVLNTIGKPPAAVTPALQRVASASSGRLQGVTSFHDEAMPTWALSKSSSVMPTARSMARAGARLSPSVTSCERGFMMDRSVESSMPCRLGAGRVRGIDGS